MVSGVLYYLGRHGIIIVWPGGHGMVSVMA